MCGENRGSQVTFCMSYCFRRVNHSNNAIVKPQPKAPTAEQREVEAAMAKVRQAQELIDSEVDPGESVSWS